MHVATGLFVIFAVWRWGDWKNWERYHSTMLYFSLCNLLYNYLTSGYFLWRLDADVLTNHTWTEMVYTFIVFPGTTILFLSNFPRKRIRQVLHIVTWILIYFTWEVVYNFTNSIVYQYGWNVWWSLLFNMVMFPMLILHHRKPILAYLLTIPITLFLLSYFEVPTGLPVELR